MAEERKYWLSGAPEKCDTCETSIEPKQGVKFYDAKTKMGPWACMCDCCQTLGPGYNKVGTGIGQEYTYDEADKKWYKTAG